MPRAAAARPGQTAGVTDGHEGPAQIDAGEHFGDWGAELQRCAQQHWWAQGIDQHGTPMAVVLAWEANRDTLKDRRLSPRSFPDDMVANGLSPETAVQVAPLFSRHGDDHRHLRAVLSTAFTPKKVEQLRPATRAIAERLADGIAAAGGACEFVAAFAEPLPPEVFAILFGLPVEDRDRMARWAESIALAFNPSMPPEHVARVEEAAAEMRAYGHERIAASRAEPGDDLVTRLVASGGRRPPPVRRRRHRHDHRLRVRRRRDHPPPADRRRAAARRAPRRLGAARRRPRAGPQRGGGDPPPPRDHLRA